MKQLTANQVKSLLEILEHATWEIESNINGGVYNEEEETKARKLIEEAEEIASVLIE